jgi:lambda repressor-like predicted transcriptional regulator
MVFDNDAESRRSRDAEVARLRHQGMSLRQIAAAVGTSLAGVQRALRRTQRQPDPVAAVALTVAVWPPDEWPRAWTTPPTGDGWQVLNPVERWRYRMATGRTDVPDHDDDHRRCCYAYGIDPDDIAGTKRRPLAESVHRTSSHP